ncbi:MAG TPA: helix-turn-helix transcriptional regulator [Thermoanaerobaculia bacterium]|jgi:transcriptional regulator with XRE-family HTH domain|nr:helix-turn-helix transcriptional regulator [Thermoanaerobaculia bacterium]
MRERPRGEALKLLVYLLRRLRGWSQEELAAAAGIDASSVSHYERGKTVPSWKTVERLAAAVGLSKPFVEACLLPALNAALRLAGPLSEPDLSGLDEPGPDLERALAGSVRSAVAAFLATLEEREPWERTGPPAPEDREQALELWSRLEPCKPEERRFLVETCREFQGWALAERLCHESSEAASDRPERALELADLAHKVAVLATREEAWRWRLEGYTLAFLGNARRVASDLKEAEATFAHAWKLWKAGAQAAPGLLPEWRLLDLEASLHRDRRRFREALDRLDQARAEAPPEAAARILVNKAATLNQMGEAEQAIEVLREAVPLVDGERDPRLLFGVRFMLAANLCALGRYAEAEPLLPEVRKLAVALKKELDLVRLLWLEARLSAGLGRTREAAATFEQVRRDFTARQMAYDGALVTLELAELYLAEGRTREVRALAEEMMWVFHSQGIHREALAALKLFFDAARGEAATAEMARRVFADIEQGTRR